MTFLLRTTALSLMVCNLFLPSSAAMATEKPKPVSTDVCSVLKTPDTFVNKVITLRGFVYLGEDHMSISDQKCAEHGIELVIISDSVPKQRDVHNFYLQMNHQGRKGYATITGVFKSDSSPLTPYVLNIQHVRDVVPKH